jgi:hypothetical protein
VCQLLQDQFETESRKVKAKKKHSQAIEWTLFFGIFTIALIAIARSAPCIVIKTASFTVPLSASQSAYIDMQNETTE